MLSNLAKPIAISASTTRHEPPGIGHWSSTRHSTGRPTPNVSNES